MDRRLLIVEDDAALAEMIAAMLAERFEVRRAGDCPEAIRLLLEFQPHLVILDLLLPGGHGLDVCRALRRVSAAPLLVLSGLNDTATKVRALDAGADDYLTKPFAMEELRARLDAIWRRSRRPWRDEGEDCFEDGSLRIDLGAKRVLRDGEELELSPTEYRLLECLVRNRGRLLSHRELLRRVWGEGYEEAVPSLHIYVHYLRQKIEPNPTVPRYIVSRKGQGYLFRPQLLPAARAVGAAAPRDA